jgi:hypothetical protein
MAVSFEADVPIMNINNNEESDLLDEISFQKPEKKTVPVRVKPIKTVFARRVIPEDDGMETFMNPVKRSAPPPPPVEEFDGGEEEEFDGGDQPGGGEQYESAGAMPSDGYKTIEDEKADLLNKITRLISKGLKSSARLTIYSDIEEIRTEYKRMTYGIEVDRSIKFQRRMLIAAVTGLEFLNSKFDPFDVELDGWSQDVMENVDNYDGVFEELHNKYKAKVNVAPEIKLLFMVGSSGLMFHLTKSMFKAAVPNMSEVMKQNPGLAQNMVDAVNRTQQAQPTGGDGRRDMKGPGMDFGSLMGMMGPPPAMQTRPGRAASPDTTSDIVSVDQGDDSREVNLENGTKKRGKSSKKKIVNI